MGLKQPGVGDADITTVLQRLKNGDYSARLVNHGGEQDSLVTAVNELATRLEMRSSALEKGDYALESLNIGVWEYRLETDSLFWSATMYNVFGRSPAEYPDARDAWAAALEPRAMGEVLVRVEKAFFEGVEFEMTYEITTGKNEKRLIYARGQVERDSTGKPSAMYGVAYDRTSEFESQREKERLRISLEEALSKAQKSETRYRNLFDNAPFGIANFDSDGQFQAINPAYCKMLGYTEEELKRIGVLGTAPEPERPFILQFLREKMKKMQGERLSIERPLVHKDGRVIPVRVTSQMSKDESGAMFLTSLVEDLTEAKAREGERNQLLNEKEVIFRSARFSILTTDLLGTITGFSKEAERLTGRRAEEVVGTVSPGLLHDPAEVVALARELSEEYGEAVEPGFDAFVYKARLGSHDERLWQVTNGAGEKIPVLLNITGLYDGNGSLYGYMGIGKDMSAEVKARAELEGQRIKNIHTSKLASLGEMAGGIAHEINNPLATIKLVSEQLAEVVKAETIDFKRVERYAESITRTTDRIAKIIQGLRNFSRDGSSDPLTAVAVGAVVTDTVSFCQERLRNRGVELRIESFPADLALLGRPVQISQVLLNLLNNASDAVEEQGEKWIALGAKADGKYVEIRVTDSGRGISEEIRQRLFEPFFTTKGVGKGTGLGLGIALGIVQQHGGDLTLARDTAHTCFVVRLPAAKLI